MVHNILVTLYKKWENIIFTNVFCLYLKLVTKVMLEILAAFDTPISLLQQHQYFLGIWKGC